MEPRAELKRDTLEVPNLTESYIQRFSTLMFGLALLLLESDLLLLLRPLLTEEAGEEEYIYIYIGNQRYPAYWVNSVQSKSERALEDCLCIRHYIYIRCHPPTSSLPSSGDKLLSPLFLAGKDERR